MASLSGQQSHFATSIAALRFTTAVPRGSWAIAGVRSRVPPSGGEASCWKRGEVALLSPEGSHKRSFRILGGQGSGRLPEALGPSNPGAPSPSPPKQTLLLQPLSAEETVVMQQLSRTVISDISALATSPRFQPTRPPSPSAVAQTVVSLGPPEGAWSPTPPIAGSWSPATRRAPSRTT